MKNKCLPRTLQTVPFCLKKKKKIQSNCEGYKRITSGGLNLLIGGHMSYKRKFYYLLE